jgi:hypothetical protein
MDTRSNGTPGREPSRQVLDRLARIDALDRSGAAPADLLTELRSLVAEAEVWARTEGGAAAGEAVDRIRSALSEPRPAGFAGVSDDLEPSRSAGALSPFTAS